MEKLKISENRRFFTRQDGKPFIWLADTVWTIAQRLKWDDAEYLMQKRKSQGFTVLQIVALNPEQDKEMKDPAGNKALLHNNLNTPNEQYFQYLDFILDKAEQYGFYVLLLPVWGELVVGHNWMGEFSDKIVTEDNAYEYGKWIGNRYKDRSNIIWCLGGDRQPVHLEIDYKDVWRSMAEGLAKGVLDKDLQYKGKEPDWEKLLITYHPCHEQETGECSTMSYWTDEESWISFIMIQSGHGLTPKNYELVKTQYDREHPMPVFDAEPAYEQMPTVWPATPSDFHGEWIVRKRAYWSLFAGSFGHTYGHASVWCMISERERDVWRAYSWFEALDRPGAWQIKILRDFLESRDLSQCIPCQKLLLEQSETTGGHIDEHIQACSGSDGSYICIYFPSGGEETIDISRLNSDHLQMSWFNPRDGQCYSQENVISNEPVRFAKVSTHAERDVIRIVTPTRGQEQDWVCVIESGENGNIIPGKAQTYGEMPVPSEVKKVFPAW
ncbi:DUF4038 domain-containing protein [Paenibacillus sp. MMS20-IR301]|uniref:apiosidase-like domain-containing protein n=1 Tax=Paenibacillus sp. MMS20-IR301 TaxID=2895946 RepID=UPI0028F083BD|nr:DUF4038 domain-containing protein [Paenibacillus sp. MMS20-IR301]WNS41827.1 DUF4038 domain-containing protein [Paenibacillus sp. MMS20-IR301]